MRKIERDMLAAIAAERDWSSGNTSIVRLDMICSLSVRLHGNEIARIDGRTIQVNVDTLRRWPTPTTKSRLRALGADVTTRRGVTYLNGKAI